MAEVKEQKIAIKELVLQIGKKEIRLTPEEAEKLHGALNDLFGKDQSAQQTLIIREKEYINVPVPYTTQPVWYWNQPWVQVTYTSGGAAGSGGITCGGNNWTINGGGTVNGFIS